MRLNWFSPLPPAKSGIADYTFGILPELSSRAEVTLWTDRAGWDSRLEKYAEVRHYRPDRKGPPPSTGPQGDAESRRTQFLQHRQQSSSPRINLAGEP